MIIDELMIGLRKSGYRVDTKWGDKVDNKDIVIELDNYEIKIETSTTYLNTISFSINFVAENLIDIITNVPKIIISSHLVLANYHHVKFIDCRNEDLGNINKISLIFEYREVITVV